MTAPDWWDRLDAIDDALPSPAEHMGKLALAAVVVAAAVGFGLGSCGTAGSAEVDALKRREDSAFVRHHRAQQATDSALRVARLAAVDAETDALRWRRRVEGLPPVTVLPPPPRVTLPPVRGGWVGVTLGADTLPATRLVAEALGERDSVIAEASDVVHAHRVALARWELVGQAVLRERVAQDSLDTVRAMRHAAQLEAERGRRWRWALGAAALGAVVGLVLGR